MRCGKKRGLSALSYHRRIIVLQTMSAGEFWRGRLVACVELLQEDVIAMRRNGARAWTFGAQFERFKTGNANRRATKPKCQSSCG